MNRADYPVLSRDWFGQLLVASAIGVSVPFLLLGWVWLLPKLIQNADFGKGGSLIVWSAGGMPGVSLLILLCLHRSPRLALIPIVLLLCFWVVIAIGAIVSSPLTELFGWVGAPIQLGIALILWAEFVRISTIRRMRWHR